MDERHIVHQMEISASDANAAALQRELEWFAKLVDTRMKLYFGADSAYASINEIPVPDASGDASMYTGFLQYYGLDIHERIILILALCPHIKPELLDVFLIENEQTKRGFTEFGGIRGNLHGGFIPTVETAAFLIAGKNMAERFRVYHYFGEEHFFAKHGILSLHTSEVNRNEPVFSSPILLSREYLSYFTTGESYQPVYSSEFPAKKITTKLSFRDLILPHEVLTEIRDIIHWITHEKTLMDECQLEKRLKPGYRALFYGPPGTGKTLTASLMGQVTGMPVFRVDLSKLVSKYIGETEKNLASIFDQAEQKNWILFFDEADALFGKRTGGNTSNDRHANQEISYLLQRIEDFPGVALLASNLKGNMDEAFIRRFQSMVYFPAPDEHDRLKLWESAFRSGNLQLDVSVDLAKIARNHPITGGSIINVLRYAAIKAVERGEPVVMQNDIEAGIRKELRKEGKG